MEEKEVYICWLNDEEKILTFHSKEGYIKKEFAVKSDFQKFILTITIRGYKVL